MKESLTSQKNVRKLLQRHGIRTKKKYGQNFLIDENTLNKIVLAAEISEVSQVLEIGTGIGTLTRALAEIAARVVTIEIDASLLPLQQETLQGLSNVEVIIGDALKLDLNTVLAAGMPRYIVANLPYYITSPLLIAFLTLEPQVKRIVVLLQREVGERLKAAPGSKQYGSLSVFAGALAEVDLIAIVPPRVFFPVPEVESCIVALTPRADHGILSLPVLELTNRALFGQRRKTIFNALRGSPHWHIGESEITAILKKLGMNPSLRGEQLSVQQIVELANGLTPYFNDL